MQYEFFSATAFAGQAVPLFVDQSLDSAATDLPVTSGALAANTSAHLLVRANGAVVTATLYRVQFVNGASAQMLSRLFRVMG